MQSKCLGRGVGKINGSNGTNQTAKQCSLAKRWKRRHPCVLSAAHSGRVHLKVSSREWGIATKCLAFWSAVRLCLSTMPTLYCNLTLCLAWPGSRGWFESKAPPHFSWTNLARFARGSVLWQRQHLRGIPMSKGSKTCRLRSSAVRLWSKRFWIRSRWRQSRAPSNSVCSSWDHSTKLTVALCDLVIRFTDAGATSRTAACLPTRRLRPGPLQSGFGREEKSGIKLRECCFFSNCNSRAAWKRILWTIPDCIIQGLCCNPDALPRPKEVRVDILRFLALLLWCHPGAMDVLQIVATRAAAAAKSRACRSACVSSKSSGKSNMQCVLIWKSNASSSQVTPTSFSADSVGQVRLRKYQIMAGNQSSGYVHSLELLNLRQLVGTCPWKCRLPCCWSNSQGYVGNNLCLSARPGFRRTNSGSSPSTPVPFGWGEGGCSSCVWRCRSMCRAVKIWMKVICRSTGNLQAAASVSSTDDEIIPHCLVQSGDWERNCASYFAKSSLLSLSHLSGVLIEVHGITKVAWLPWLNLVDLIWYQIKELWKIKSVKILQN